MGLINREALLSFEKMDADLCASCGEHHTAEHGYAILSKYCHNCGAKMDGGAGNG